MNDASLAKRCRSGEVAAWEEFYTQYNPILIAHLQSALKTNDTDFIDEIAQQVWCAVIADDGAILDKYDPSLGSLSTFLRMIARDKSARFLRAESRRRTREMVASRTKTTYHDNSDLDDFLTTLTPREFDHVTNHLLDVKERTATPNYFAQLSYQIRRKINQFFG